MRKRNSTAVSGTKLEGAFTARRACHAEKNESKVH